MAYQSPREPIPRNQPIWTWIWLAFAVLTVILTIVGFMYAGGAR